MDSVIMNMQSKGEIKMEPTQVKSFVSVNGNEVIMTNDNLRELADEFDDSRDIAHAADTLTDGTPVELWLWTESTYIFLDVCVKKENIPQTVNLSVYEDYLCQNGFKAETPEGWKKSAPMDSHGEYRLQFSHCYED